MKKQGVVTLIGLSILMIMLGAGCRKMDTNEEIIEIMKSYAEEKYGETFEVVEFTRAADISRNHVLALSDGKETFTVRAAEQDDHQLDLTDDRVYTHAGYVIADYLKQSEEYQLGDAEVAVDIDYEEVLPTVEDYKKVLVSSAKELLEYPISSITVVVRMNTEIENNTEGLYKLYKDISPLCSLSYAFAVINMPDSDMDLYYIMHNMGGGYKSDWAKFPGIKSYLCIGLDSEVNSMDEFLSEVKR